MLGLIFALALFAVPGLVGAACAKSLCEGCPIPKAFPYPGDCTGKITEVSGYWVGNCTFPPDDWMRMLTPSGECVQTCMSGHLPVVIKDAKAKDYVGAEVYCVQQKLYYKIRGDPRYPDGDELIPFDEDDTVICLAVAKV
ncbi:unnamed protein product, partial [Mesorhabditis spiculigera]